MPKQTPRYLAVYGTKKHTEHMQPVEGARGWARLLSAWAVFGILGLGFALLVWWLLSLI